MAVSQAIGAGRRALTRSMTKRVAWLMLDGIFPYPGKSLASGFTCATPGIPTARRHRRRLPNNDVTLLILDLQRPGPGAASEGRNGSGYSARRRVIRPRLRY